MMVIIHHTEQFKDMLGEDNYWDNGTVQVMGKLGVVLFFVLSGFLISFLLFREQKLTNTISIRDFYKRRILRVWPLYFLIIIVALFIMPFINFFSMPGVTRNMIWDDLSLKILFYVFFLPNLVNLMGFIPYAAQTWSIGCEEQFYLFWPHLNKRLKNKWKLMIWTIIFYLAVKFIFLQLPDRHYIITFRNYWNSTPFDCMAIGGIFAIIISDERQSNIRKFIFSRYTQWITFLTVVILIATGCYIPYFHFEIYSILFGILIANFAANTNRIFSMEHPLLNYLGKISYGIYMFHPVAIIASIKILQMAGVVNNFILIPMVLVFVIILSAISYQFFEKRFIKMKIRFSKIVSGDNIR